MNTVLNSAVAETLLYHEQTKHHFHRYARSAGFLDWANQPNPFRCYEGVTAVRLPLLQKDPPAWPKHSASDVPNGRTLKAWVRLALGFFYMPCR